ncbi:putative extracelular cellulose binding protein [Halenospora varia]|nr:putative extracelular cellulose binding protein [Halenospora varia]
MKFLAPIIFALPILAAPQNVAEDLAARCPALPVKKTLTANQPKLADPFLFENGKKVASQRDLACRQREISKLAQYYELGDKPGEPSDLSTSWNATSNEISVTVTNKGKSITFKSKITYPATGEGPFPALIGIGGSTIPIPDGVAYLAFKNDEMAEQNGKQSRGKGLFYDLYGKDATTGSLMAWAWGVSRLIDGLEMTEDANINTNRLAVTGCSRNGKGAFITGAFDGRIALTIPQESGSGGSACWRLSDAMKAAGVNTQTASQIIQENSWQSEEFAKYNSSANLLPFDHHTIAGLIAPRGLLVIENNIDWLGPQSSWGCMKTAHKIWEATGDSDNMGYTLTGLHSHCQFQAAEQATLTAFVDKFLKGNRRANTAVMNYNITNPTNFVFDESKWVDWTVPQLN